jgi:hypothetical protein
MIRYRLAILVRRIVKTWRAEHEAMAERAIVLGAIMVICAVAIGKL